MSGHLLTQTLPREVVDLARYYTRGMEPGTEEDRQIAALAEQVARGSLRYGEALDDLLAADLARGGNGDTETEGRLGKRLADATDRVLDGDRGETAAEPRRDMHPLVAKGLGIDPSQGLTREELNALLAGWRTDGEKIEGKQLAKPRQYTDARTGEQEESVPIGSVDFCLTPDKSVSVAWAFAAPAEQASVYQAHRDAAHQAMLHLEREIGRARKGKGGQDGYDPGHIGWVAFDHYTSRPTVWVARDEHGKRITESVAVQVAGDPDLHTHFTVANAVFCDNGRVGSLDLGRLDGLIKETGALYQAHVATELRKLGADVILDPETGAARLTAIPEAVRLHFSKRTQGGEEAARTYARSLGLDWDTLPPDRRAGLLKAGVQGIALGSDGIAREKLKKDDMADFTDWRRQAAELGWNHGGILAHGPPAPDLTRDQRMQMAYEQALPWLEKELNQRAVISGPDARTAAARGLIASGIEDASDIERVTDRFMAQGVMQYGERTSLIIGQEGQKQHPSVTTALHVSDEREFIRLAKAAAADRSDALTPGQLQAAVQQTGLRFEKAHGRAQRAGMESLGTGGRLGVLIGAAGAGKTTLLQPLVAAWQAEGRQVYGIALAWRQADDLTDAGIQQRQVKAYSVFMDAVKAGEVALDPRAVVVVDELSLLGTRQSLELLRLQETHGFRIAMLGDDKQCASIEAGPIIDLARKALGDGQVPEILTTIRQETKRERQIAGLLRTGRPDDVAQALSMKRDDGTVELVPGGYREAVERTAELVAARIQANAQDPSYSLTVSAPTNMDAHRLGVAIRDKRREIGQLGPDQVKLKAADRDGNAYEMAIAAGDKVRLFFSTKAEGKAGSIGRNGSVLTVLDAGQRGMQVRNVKGTEGFIRWKSLADRSGRVQLAYGEVMTTHTAQGSTSTEHVYALPAGSKAVTGFSAYSSSTRHRRASYLMLSAGAEQAATGRSRPLNDIRPITEADVWANVANNLARQPTKGMALDFLARAHDVRIGAAKALQQGMRPAERNARRGQQPTVLHQTISRNREARAITPVVERLYWIAQRQKALAQRLAQVGPAVMQAARQRVERLRPAVDHGRQQDGPRISL